MSRSEEILAALVAFDTVSARSNLPLIDWAEALLRGAGARVTRLPDPEMAKAGIHAAFGPQVPGGVVLSAHSDVVPVEGQDWTRPPFRLTIEGDRLHGRGTTDMKGFLAAMLACAEQAAGQDLARPLHLVISYDEEVGCTGIARMAGRLAPLLARPSAALIGEPTGMQVAIGHKGKQGFRAICHGEAGHSALAPQFTNALHVACDFIAGLRAMQAGMTARDPAYSVPMSTLHVGRLSGGTALNIVPDRAELDFEIRYLPQDDPAQLQAGLDRAAAEAMARNGPAARIEIARLAAYPGLATAPGAEVTRAAQGWAGAAGTTKVAFGTEAGVFDGLGVPAVVCGPGSMAGQGHKADEYIERAQLAACDAMLARVLASLT